ncbi:hypothetical protein [Neptuniibacter pectenicola]|uniref:hypothetical protein n=1 Tax=Neptuniibacter pectenicola TaxID=1806669 RepID=UPI00082FB14F|nr:hypothetical protein [Neptuniibacter pectenicola]
MNILVRYLKPNFQITYYLNLFLVLVVFIGSFSISSIALAFDDDGSWQDGKYWLYFNANNSSSGYAPTASGLCANLGGQYDASRFGVNYCQGIGYMYHEFCGSYQSTSTFINESGCGQFPDPVIDCAGSDGSPVNLHVPLKSENGQPIIGEGSFPTDVMYSDGCKYGLEDSNSTPELVEITDTETGEVFLALQNSYVFLNSEPTSPDGSLDVPSPSETNDINPNYSSDNTVDTTDTTTSDPVSVTNPDGSEVTTEQTSTTETRGDGTTVTTTSDTQFVSESNGIIKNEITTTTTYDFVDGTSTVETETHTEYTQTPITNYTIDNSTGTIVVNANGGSSAGTTTITTDTYDSAGNKVSSSQTSTNQGGGDAQEQKESEECKADPSSCKEFKKTGSGSFDLAGASADLEAAKLAYSEYIDTLKSEVSDSIGFNFTGGGQIESYEVDFHGVTGDIGLTRWIPYFDAFDLGALVMFIAAMVSLYILLGGRSD